MSFIFMKSDIAFSPIIDGNANYVVFQGTEKFAIFMFYLALFVHFIDHWCVQVLCNYPTLVWLHAVILHKSCMMLEAVILYRIQFHIAEGSLTRAYTGSNVYVFVCDHLRVSSLTHIADFCAITRHKVSWCTAEGRQPLGAWALFDLYAIRKCCFVGISWLTEPMAAKQAQNVRALADWCTHGKVYPTIRHFMVDSV